MSELNLTEKIDNNNETPSDNPNNNVEVNQNTSVPKDENADVSPSSGVSSASSTVSKSGIRPPSRIGRPCGGIQKPAIPATPTKNSSDDSIRRLTDDYGRHKLTVGSTASSMDGLWELHPRRLSEAGLSRHSDSSAVLTEDTDSFMIGQRVWVGGTKPGTIAYIGETQFAPGEWAGIALDEPIGKNDGSVGGIRYFQCESKKGVFSRLTRLTRVPLEQPGMGSNETFISPNNGVRKSPISPTGSTRSLLRSAASLSNSNTSLNSTATHVDFKIGDRVIIKSTQGSKVGTVRYMGLTDFAPGEWVGVELDDPRGKNDGSVEGKRYFECRPNFGLFAPIAKVSKSPSKHKPSACVVHSGPGLPPSGLKRANSRDSMTSLASKTSVASSVRRVRLGVTSLTPKKVSPKTTSTPLPTRTVLQDVLREKQQHIEQLLKERDLERAEITRAASQADEAEQRFFDLKKEFEQYRAECEAKVRENGDVLAELKIDQAKLLSQLEDEKRRNEDLEFKFEEASITRSDVEVTNESHIKKIRELERSLAEERQKTEALELTSNKLFEAEENLIKTREEVESLKNELAETRKKRTTTEEEKTVTAQLVESLKQQIEGASVENKEKTDTINQLTEEISKVKSEHEVSKREAEATIKKYGENCGEHNKIIEDLKIRLAQQKEITQQHETTIDQLKKENEKLKMDLSGRSHDFENANDQLVAKDNEIKSLQMELEVTKKEIIEKADLLERHKSNSQNVEEAVRKELAETREELKSKITELENVKQEYNVQISQKDQELENSNKKIVERSAEVTQLTEELNTVKTNFEDSKKEIHSRHARQIDTQEAQLMALSAEIQQKDDEITKSSIVISKLEEDLCAKNGIIEKLRLELEHYTQQQTDHTATSSALNTQLNELILAKGDLERKVAAAYHRVQELTALNEGLQSQVQALSVHCNAAQQLEVLRREVIEKQEMLVALRTEFEQKLHLTERQRDEFRLQYETTTSNFERIRSELESKLQITVKSETSLRERCENTISELAKVRDDYKIKLVEFQQLLQEKDFAIQSISGKTTEKETYYQDQLRAVTEQLNQNIQGCQQKIHTLTDETIMLKQQLSEKTEQLIVVNADASRMAAQYQQLEKETQQKYQDDLRRLQFELNEKNIQLQKYFAELELVKNECHTSNTDREGKNHQISELTIQVKESQTIISQLREQLTILQMTQGASKTEFENANSRCQGLLEEVASLTERVRLSEEVSTNLNIQYNNAMLLVNKLRITEQQKQQCLELLRQETASNQLKNCDHLVAMLNQMKVDNCTDNTQTILSLERQIEVLRNELAQRNREFDAQKTEFLHLQEELLRIRDVKGVSGNGCQDDSLIQDKELAENQIRFLNSIIVDIQKKNEEQRARIEILEAGYSPAMANDLNLCDPPDRQIPPRVYCDICEEFDAHETEDCPQQNSDLGAPLDDDEY